MEVNAEPDVKRERQESRHSEDEKQNSTKICDKVIDE